MNPEINTFSIINNFKFEFYDVGYILTSVPLVLEYIILNSELSVGVELRIPMV